MSSENGMPATRVHDVVRRALDGFERDLMFRKDPSPFEKTVRHSKHPSISTTPTMSEMMTFAEFGVFVIQTNESQERGSYVIDKECTAILCHPDDEKPLREKLRQLQTTRTRKR